VGDTFAWRACDRYYSTKKRCQRNNGDNVCSHCSRLGYCCTTKTLSTGSTDEQFFSSSGQSIIGRSTAFFPPIWDLSSASAQVIAESNHFSFRITGWSLRPKSPCYPTQTWPVLAMLCSWDTLHARPKHLNISNLLRRVCSLVLVLCSKHVAEGQYSTTLICQEVL
jgi:hypothetical protein